MHFYTYQKVESGTSGGILYDNFYAVLSTPGGIPIAGDWDGDGYDSIGVYNPDNQIWHLSNAVAGDANIDYQLTFGENGGWPFSGGWRCFEAYCVTKVTGLGYYKSGVFNLKEDLNMAAPVNQISYGNAALTPGIEVWPLSGYWSQTGFSYYGTVTPTPTATPTNWAGCDASTTLNGVIVPPLQAPSNQDNSADGGGGQVYVPNKNGDHSRPPHCSQVPPTNTPTRLPTSTVPPTNTRRPTITPTPSSVPVSCDITGTTGGIRFRNQPSTDPGNDLFTVNGLNITGLQTARAYLWPNNQVPSPPPTTIATARALAKLGVITWVNPTAVWYQVEVVVSGVTLIGYMANTTNVLEFSVPGCDGVLPTQVSLPTSYTRQSPVEFNVPPIASVFGNIPPSYMGACGLHFGLNCADGSGSTLDIIPQNLELCIDTRNVLAYGECDLAYTETVSGIPSWADALNGKQGIPVYAPVGGIATLNVDRTIRFRIGLKTGSTTEYKQINFSHMIPLSSILSSGAVVIPITAGQKIGFLCPNNDSLKVTLCRVRDADTPTHLAFQLQYQIGDTNNPIQVAPDSLARQEVLGLLAIPRCLHDDWLGMNGAPSKSQNPRFKICP
jgi:hypothetical protein